jgi:hypothetical protein
MPRDAARKSARFLNRSIERPCASKPCASKPCASKPCASWRKAEKAGPAPPGSGAEALAATCAAGRDHPAAALGGHAGTETVTALPHELARLIGPFHGSVLRRSRLKPDLLGDAAGAVRLLNRRGHRRSNSGRLIRERRGCRQCGPGGPGRPRRITGTNRPGPARKSGQGGRRVPEGRPRPRPTPRSTPRSTPRPNPRPFSRASGPVSLRAPARCPNRDSPSSSHAGNSAETAGHCHAGAGRSAGTDAASDASRLPRPSCCFCADCRASRR